MTFKELLQAIEWHVSRVREHQPGEVTDLSLRGIPTDDALQYIAEHTVRNTVTHHQLLDGGVNLQVGQKLLNVTLQFQTLEQGELATEDKTFRWQPEAAT